MRIQKILHANVDNKNKGGAFVLTYQAEKYLRNYGYSYDYVTMDEFVNDSKDYPIPKDVITYSARLRNNRFIGHIALPFYVNRVLKKSKYSIIHIDTDSAWKALLYAVPAKKNNVKVLVHSHSTGIDGNHLFLKKICESFSKSILKLFCDYYVACSTSAAKWIVPSGYEKNVEVIPNGIDMERFYFDIEERKKIRSDYGFGDSIVIGNVGLFSENKNQKYLVNLLDHLVANSIDAKLLLVGNNMTEYGEEVERLVHEKTLKDRVVFTGASSNVRQLMNAMDMYIQVSNFEGFGLVSVEAQATGLPTFISNTLPKEAFVSDWSFQFDVETGIELIKQYISDYDFDIRKRLNRKISKKNGIEYFAESMSIVYGKLTVNK